MIATNAIIIVAVVNSNSNSNKETVYILNLMS